MRRAYDRRRVGARGRQQGLAILLCLLMMACAGLPPSERIVSTVPTLTLSPGQVVAVIGLQQEEAERAAAHDVRVGFGLTHLLAESLFAAGKFRLMEEKEVHKRTLLEDLVQTYWVQTRPAYAAPELSQVGTQLDVALLAYGSIATFTSSGAQIALGVASHTKHTLRVRVTVCLYAVASAAILCREGQGMASQTGTAVIYMFRQDRLDFEQSAIGRATHQAVVLAVQALTASVHFTP